MTTEKGTNVTGKDTKRTMKIYAGGIVSRKHRETAEKLGMGTMIFPTWLRPAKDLYYALDNGAFMSFVKKKPFDADKFIGAVQWAARQTVLPDFVVIPDIVAGGKKSLEFSAGWIELLHEYGLTGYLAVQDGMTEEDVDVCDFMDGIFVGGTLEWKYETAGSWIKYAHERGLKCHIGRVGTVDRIKWAAQLGADSIDSSSWTRNDTFHYVEKAIKELKS